MRADRLISILLLMQARGRVTATQLADELEISVITARRDLEALSASGVPVYPQPGRGGGWSLLGGSRIDLSGLTLGEAQALFALIGPTAGGDAEVRSAVRKLLRALPETFRPDAEFAASAIVPDAAAWGAGPRPEPEALPAVRDAVLRRVRLLLHYRGWSGHESTLKVDPLGLAEKDGTWYLMAITEDGHRTFRVDRMRDAAPTDEAAERPPDFDFAPEWQRVVAEVDARRLRASARIETDAAVLPWLRADFGSGLTVDDRTDAHETDAHEMDAAGRVRATVSAQSHDILARRLAGWGSRVRVIEPAEVRAELARIGRQLTT